MERMRSSALSLLFEQMGVALQKGKSYQIQRASEKELYERTKRAEGDKIRKVAEATKAELLNEA